jgi:uncharacterized membrane protein
VKVKARQVAVLAIGIATVAALIIAVPVPIPVTGGYVHPGAVAEVFLALAFGPVVGMLAAGLGAMTADLILGFASFAPLSLVAHGALGLLVGLIGWKQPLGRMALGWLAGGLALVALYFLGESTVYQLGVSVALAEVPLNALQVSLGVLGLTLFRLVKAAYPQIELLGNSGFKQE